MCWTIHIRSKALLSGQASATNPLSKPAILPSGAAKWQVHLSVARRHVTGHVWATCRALGSVVELCLCKLWQQRIWLFLDEGLLASVDWRRARASRNFCEIGLILHTKEQCSWNFSLARRSEKFDPEKLLCALVSVLDWQFAGGFPIRGGRLCSSISASPKDPWRFPGSVRVLKRVVSKRTCSRPGLYSWLLFLCFTYWVHFCYWFRDESWCWIV